MLKLGFLCSHNGSLMQATVHACKEGRLAAVPSILISNNKNSGAVQFAMDNNLPWKHLSSATHKTADLLDQAILNTLQEHQIELVLLLGYMKLLGPKTIAAYPRRILNIHPALLPRFGGSGMFGIHVHEAVIAAGVKETGITIHHVNEHYDEGDIIAQKKLAVLPDDTPQILAARVLGHEKAFIVETLQNIASGAIVLQ